MDAEELAKNRKLYAVLEQQHLSETEMALFIGKMITHLQILAIQAKLPSIAQHLDAAISACAAKRLN